MIKIKRQTSFTLEKALVTRHYNAIIGKTPYTHIHAKNTSKFSIWF